MGVRAIPVMSHCSLLAPKRLTDVCSVPQLTFTKLFSRLFSKKEMRILMVRSSDGVLLPPLPFACRSSARRGALEAAH